MSIALVPLGPQAIQQGGQGLDFKSKLFALKPATININQPTTQAEGAIKGHLRISETGDQFKEMFVTLLQMPQESRSFYAGEPGQQLMRTADNLMCFSRDLFRPDPKARVPQALKCDGCPKASWDKWRQNKVKENIPPCDAYYYALFIDTVFKMPLQMYIRSKSKKAFEQGMQNLSRTFAKLKSQGGNPNIFDIRFRLFTKPEKNGNTTTYSLALDGFQAISEAEREAFGDVYLQYVNRNRRTEEEQAAQQAADQVDAATTEIDNAITGAGPVEGEYLQTPDQTITI